MSPPMVRGADAATVTAFVQRSLGWRGPRVPFKFSGLDGAHAALICAETLRRFCVASPDNFRLLSRVDLALVALENYYRAIGSEFDAGRMASMRAAVAWAIEDQERAAAAAQQNRVGDAWDRAFRRAFLGTTHARMETA